MIERLLGFLLMTALFSGCLSPDEQFLDYSIPRVVTPAGQIAFVRTKWLNGKLQQTTFLDKQDRVLEDFMYGRTSRKILNQYQGNKLAASIHYDHSDSSPAGYVQVTERRFEYDQAGRVVRVHWSNSEIKPEGVTRKLGSSIVGYEYKSPYDTLISRMPSLDYSDSTITNIDRWERNRKGQLVRNFRLYVTNRPQLDTIYYDSHRFSYDELGRRKLAWYDLMYLGQFYLPAGPDTIKYSYDQRNRVVREEHIYTTDVRNKREIDTTRLDKFYRESVRSDRQRFFVGDSIFHNNKKTNIVDYRYESFNPAKHLPLQVTQDTGY